MKRNNKPPLFKTTSLKFSMTTGTVKSPEQAKKDYHFAKLADFPVFWLTQDERGGGGEENVAGLDIAVQEVLAVSVVQSFHQLTCPDLEQL